jgi:hypothetical protein
MVSSYIASNLGGFVEYRKFSLTYADLTTAGTTQTIALFTLPANSKILGVYQKTSVAFSGGSLSTMTVSVGSALSATQFTATYDAFAAVNDTNVQETAMFKSGTAAAQAVNAYWTGSHNVNTATAGAIDICVLFLNVTTP